MTTPESHLIRSDFHGPDPSRAAVIIKPDVTDLIHVAAATAERGLDVQTFDYEAYQLQPRRAKGIRVVTDVASLRRELDRRPPEPGRATAWASPTAGAVTVVYDEHDELPGWREDRLELRLQQDADWRAWSALDGKLMGQLDFADHLDALSHTLVEPTPADLLGRVQTLRITRNSEFESSVDLVNGEQVVGYKVTSGAAAGARGDLQLPELLMLRLTPWEGGPLYDVRARVVLRTDGDHLRLGVRIPALAAVRRQAWADVIVGVTEAGAAHEVTVLAAP